MTAFPNSLWGIVESSSNMTPRGLKYAFSTSSYSSENLESYMLSKRDFKDSDYKFMLFIWNGKNCSPILKSSVLIKAFDLDKKLSCPRLLPYLYNGYYVKLDSIEKGQIVNLNSIINNTVEHLTEEASSNALSSDSFLNFHETVYLLQWLYPISDEKIEKKNVHKKDRRNLLFGKFNDNFLSNKNCTKDYYSLFTVYDPRKQLANTDNETNVVVSSENYESNNDEDNSLNDMDTSSLNEEDEDLESIDVNEIPTSQTEKHGGDFKLDLKKINLSNLASLNGTTTLNNSSVNKYGNNNQKITVPKLNFGIQHKVLNNEIISQRTKRNTEDEERLDNLPPVTIQKSCNKISKTLGLKLDLQGIKDISTDKAEIEKLNEECNGRESQQKKAIMYYFSKVLSEIMEGFLYLSSYNAASNKELVYSHKITHIINAAADVCQNTFEGDIIYLSYNLKDQPMEVYIY